MQGKIPGIYQKSTRKVPAMYGKVPGVFKKISRKYRESTRIKQVNYKEIIEKVQKKTSSSKGKVPVSV